MIPKPSDDEILSAASFWGARDVDHPPVEPITYKALLERCCVFPVHGSPACVAHLELRIRKAYEQYGAKLDDGSKSKRFGGGR